MKVIEKLKPTGKHEETQEHLDSLKDMLNAAVGVARGNEGVDARIAKAKSKKGTPYRVVEI